VEVNFPCKSTNGTGVPFSSRTNIGGTGVASLLLLHHLHQKLVKYTPVPSSVVTKSPEITLKAFSAFWKYQWH
jgi:hypothetical protein